MKNFGYYHTNYGSKTFIPDNKTDGLIWINKIDHNENSNKNKSLKNYFKDNYIFNGYI